VFAGMSRKLLIAVLAVAAFGCARSASTPVTHAKTTPKTVAVHPRPREVQPAHIVKELTLDPQPEVGVALHGPEKKYLEQVDNSGWSGRSPEPPSAIGGGPQDETQQGLNAEEQSEEK